jgi:hypothetical protein
MQAVGGWAASPMSLIALLMKHILKYAVLLVLLAASHAAFAEAHATPLERARQIAELTSSGPHDPAPPMPASDILTVQLSATFGHAGSYGESR